MEERRVTVEEAMEELHQYLLKLSDLAEKPTGYGEVLWDRVKRSGGILRELAYFHDKGEFWGQYKVNGYTLMDILIWQVDHFKAYMDRGEEMNRWRRERLFLESLEVMAMMEEDPLPYILKMQNESGTDSDQRY